MDNKPIKVSGYRFVAEAFEGDRLMVLGDRLFVVNPDRAPREICADGEVREVPAPIPAVILGDPVVRYLCDEYDTASPFSPPSERDTHVHRAIAAMKRAERS